MSPQYLLPFLAFVLLAPEPQQLQRKQLSHTTSLTTGGCSGCTGGGSSAGASGGSCGGMMDISITMTDGQCRWYLGTEPTQLDCRPVKGCLPQVTRTWSGIGANQPMDFCVTIGGVRLCLDPPPSSGNGSGSDTRDSASMPCDDGSRDLSFSIPSCTMSATAMATCSRCRAAL